MLRAIRYTLANELSDNYLSVAPTPSFAALDRASLREGVDSDNMASYLFLALTPVTILLLSNLRVGQ